MKVALFSGNYNYVRDGANQALNKLVRYFEDREGWEVRVYSPVTDTPAFEPSGTLVPVPSITPPVRSEFRLALGLSDGVRRDIERFAPDLFHVSAPDILGTRAQTLAKKLGVPIVASFHTRFETYLDFYGLRWLRPAIDAHLRRFYRRSDHILAPTPAIAAELSRLVGADRVSLWGRGVDPERFNPARRDPEWRRANGIADDEIAVLLLGRLVVEKGAETYIAVMTELAKRGHRLRPLVVGDGPARSLFDRLSDAVMIGHVDGDDLARAVASADILLMPSTTEAFGNVVLESMASGLAIVSADAQSSAALLRDGQSGLLCAPGDIAAYADAMESLIVSRDRREALGSAALADSAGYRWDDACRQVAGVYRRLIETRAAERPSPTPKTFANLT
jgi:phosphatidylinositol alpha 1,6-mannosyltransferase